jgi:hypothetical protein
MVVFLDGRRGKKSVVAGRPDAHLRDGARS